ncbi:MAG: hypothetical protein CR997_06220 [Acidobacteria bacterium]|nr:MAG: hypothetical protein CR997_06220 [Acidobacteriota bacterium]
MLELAVRENACLTHEKKRTRQLFEHRLAYCKSSQREPDKKRGKCPFFLNFTRCPSYLTP